MSNKQRPQIGSKVKKSETHSTQIYKAISQCFSCRFVKKVTGPSKKICNPRTGQGVSASAVSACTLKSALSQQKSHFCRFAKFIGPPCRPLLGALVLLGGYGHRVEANRTPFRRFRTPRRRAGKVSDMISESLFDINRNRCPI